ncbi:MAG: 8-amino-7-oxononanoate synthase [Carbonactinosporaceae bacterium]
MSPGPPPASAPDPLGWLAERAVARETAGLRRRLRHRDARGDGLLDLAGNDYLGLSQDPRVVAGAIEAAGVWGAGSTGSRLVTGSTALHVELESALAAYLGFEAGLLFSSGYLANLGVISALAGPGDLVLSDAWNHASIVDGCRLARARVGVMPHRDADAVEKALADRQEERALVVTDAVFSVDGDLAPLRQLAGACRRHGAVLVVDEAHALGVVGPGGRGAAHAAELAGAHDVVVTLSCSKALGTQGGIALGGEAVIDHLVDAARPFIFDTGLAPACAGAALAALRVLQDSPELAAAVRGRARELHTAAASLGLAAAAPDGGVVAVRVGSPEAAVAAATRCAQQGVRVGCFRPPSVPDDTSRLRLTARANLTDADLDQVRAALAAAVTPV